MGRAPDLDRLEEAVRKMGGSLTKEVEDAMQKQAVLKDVFRVNHEIGRIAREFPSMGPVLRDMQLEVNFVTIQTKRGGLGQAREGYGRVLASLDKVRSALTRASRDESLVLRKNL
ncbi:MAG: hypothetical protein OK474_03775 [Thaumarchaeota archaeon]|nr:hypothetical protein [Nitrososphaerota archaeon]